MCLRQLFLEYVSLKFSPASQTQLTCYHGISLKVSFQYSKKALESMMNIKPRTYRPAYCSGPLLRVVLRVRATAFDALMKTGQNQGDFFRLRVTA